MVIVVSQSLYPSDDGRSRQDSGPIDRVRAGMDRVPDLVVHAPDRRGHQLDVTATALEVLGISRPVAVSAIRWTGLAARERSSDRRRAASAG